MASIHPVLLARELGKEMIFIYVGPDGEEYFIHKKLLCTMSSWFCASLSEIYLERETGEIKLPEETPRSFDFFAQWLYSYNLPLFDPEALQDGREYAFTLFELYVLADKFIIPELVNKTMDRLRETFQYFDLIIDPEFLTAVYNKTYYNSPLREFALDMVAYKMAKKFSKNLYIEASQPQTVGPQAFYNDLEFQALAKVADERGFGFDFLVQFTPHLGFAIRHLCGDPRKQYADRCNYHLHKEGEYCGEGPRHVQA